MMKNECKIYKIYDEPQTLFERRNRKCELSWNQGILQ